MLKLYAKEIGVHDLTLDQLIESHRYLRSLNLENSVTRMKEADKGFSSGYSAGVKASKITNDTTIGELLTMIDSKEG